MSGSVNRVILVGSLTRDPELRTLPDGGSVCALRVALNESVKDANTGEWRDRANYFDVDVFGSQGEGCGKWLSKGRQVAIEGRLRWREWKMPDGQKRSVVSVVADNVQFLGQRESRAGEGRGGHVGQEARLGDFPAEIDPDDDIPF